MRRAADNDHASFAGVYDATIGRAYNVALEIIRDPAQTGTAIVAAYREIWEFSHACVASGQRAESWVMATVHRIAVEHARLGEQGALSVGATALPDATPRAAPRAARRAARRRWPSGAALTQTEREALELAYFGGYTHREVDALIQISPGSTVRHLRDSLRELSRVNLSR